MNLADFWLDDRSAMFCLDGHRVTELWRGPVSLLALYIDAERHARLVHPDDAWTP